MKKAMKSAMVALLAAAMAAGVLSGCGEQAQTGTGYKTGVKFKVEDVFKIGGMGPTTGENASYGLSVKNGAQVAVDEINAAGGVNGMKFELVFEDDESNAQKASNAYNKLMDSGVHAILGATTTDPTIALGRLTKEDGILQITPSGSGQECTKYDNAFRICFTDPLQGESMADYIYTTMGKKKIAIVYQNTTDYSKGITEAFEKKFQELGGTVSVKEAFGDDDVDFKTQLTKVKSSDAEAIFVPAYYEKVSFILKQAKELGITLPFFGCDGWDGVLKQLGADSALAEGAIFLTPFAANEQDAAVQKFVSAYQQKYNAVPDQFAADAYDGVYVIKAAIEKAGIKANAEFVNDDLINAMTQISIEGLTGDMTFTKEGEPNKAAKVVEVKNGEYTVKE